MRETLNRAVEGNSEAFRKNGQKRESHPYLLSLYMFISRRGQPNVEVRSLAGANEVLRHSASYLWLVVCDSKDSITSTIINIISDIL